MNNAITIKTGIKAPLTKVWEAFTKPEHIMHWNHASDDWHSPSAKNDLRETGRFSYRMEAKDGSMGFDFEGTFTAVKKHKYLAYILDDDRKVEVHFTKEPDKVIIEETFEAENLHPKEMQQQGWQAILDNFKCYTENTNF